MELEEAKKILMGLPEYQDLVSKEFEAIDTVISELVALQELLDEKREEIEEYQKQLDLDYVDENYISKDKIKEKLEEQTKRIDKLLEDMVDKSTGCINVSYLSKKEKEELIAKRNSLVVQKATLQQVKEELLKGE